MYDIAAHYAEIEKKHGAHYDWFTGLIWGGSTENCSCEPGNHKCFTEDEWVQLFRSDQRNRKNREDLDAKATQ